MKDIKITRQNQLDAILELTVRTLAAQRAGIKIILDVLVDSDDKLVSIYEKLNAQILKEDQEVRDVIFSQFGELDLNDLK